MRLNLISAIALVLVIIGALNWGLVGLFEFDVVAALFGPMSLVTRAIYVVVGFSALCVAYHWAAARTRDPERVDAVR